MDSIIHLSNKRASQAPCAANPIRTSSKRMFSKLLFWGGPLETKRYDRGTIVLNNDSGCHSSCHQAAWQCNILCANIYVRVKHTPESTRTSKAPSQVSTREHIGACLHSICLHPSIHQPTGSEHWHCLWVAWCLKLETISFIARGTWSGAWVCDHSLATRWTIVLIQHLIVDKLQGKVPELIKSEPFVWKSASSSTRLGKLFFKQNTSATHTKRFQ